MSYESTGLHTHVNNESESEILETEHELLPHQQPSLAATELTKQTKPQRWTSQLLDTWLYEILAVVFSVGCLVAIVCILMVFNGKPTPTFAYSITLNTIISLLATASKASLAYMIGQCTGQLKWLWFYREHEKRPLSGMQVFDSASRGPLGALAVLVHHRGRSLVSLGALIMVLTLPYDAFVQQILTYPIRNTIKEVNSTHAPAKRVVSLLVDRLGDDVEDIVQIGQWSDDFSVNPTCPSGNCTWPLFQSVEMCNDCRDIINSTTVTCSPLPVNSTASVYPGKQQSCTVNTPRGFGSTSITFFGASNGSFEMDIPEHVVWGQYLVDWIDTDRPYPETAVAHAEIAVADKERFYQGYPADLDVGSILKVASARECALALCARTYNVSVSNGVVSIRTSSPPDYGSQFWVDIRNGTVFSGKRQDWGAGSAISETKYSMCWRPGDGPAVKVTPLSATSWVNESESAFCPVANLGGASSLVGETRVTYTSSNGQIASNYNWDPRLKRIRDIGLDETMSRIAASFTKRALLASNATAGGTILLPEVYVRVEWPWIIQPAAITVLGIVFLVSTILVNRRQGLSLWKSSTLAVLYHGLSEFGDEEERTAENTATVSQMERSAQAVRVRLRVVDPERGLMLD